MNTPITGFNPAQMNPAVEVKPQSLPKQLMRDLQSTGTQPATFKAALVQGIESTAKINDHASAPVNFVRAFVEGVDAKDKSAAAMRTAFLAGESTNLHQTVIASQEASLSFSLMVELRNKVLESYQELMRIQI